MPMPSEFTDVFAVPGENWIIDVINPSTGVSAVNGCDLAGIRQRYPTAERVPWEHFRAAAAARQQTPIVWEPTTADQYNEMLEILPPAYWADGAFLVGEPSDHCFATGRPRFTAYAYRAGRPCVASRPLTVAELKAETNRTPGKD